MRRRHFALVALALLIAAVSLAPAYQRPEKISGAQPEWNAEPPIPPGFPECTGEFVFPSLEVHTSLVGPDGDIDGFAYVTLTLKMNAEIIVVAKTDGPMPLTPRPNSREHGYWTVQPLRVYWDFENCTAPDGWYLLDAEIELEMTSGQNYEALAIAVPSFIQSRTTSRA